MGDNEDENQFYIDKASEAKATIEDWFPGQVDVVMQVYGTSGEFKIMISNSNLRSGALVHENKLLKMGFEPSSGVKKGVSALLAGKPFDEQTLGLAKQCEAVVKAEEEK